jgi:acyl-CoA thioester hydrolase
MVGTSSDISTLLLHGSVKAEWVDYNGHMGDFAYGIVFSDAVTAFMDLIGIDEIYRVQKKCTIYTLEARIAYLKECHEGQEFKVYQQLLDLDDKKCHVFQRMIEASSGEELAFSEQLLMHMQQSPGALPKAAKFPDAIKATLDAIMQKQSIMAVPDWVGRRIGIRRRPTG